MKRIQIVPIIVMFCLLFGIIFTFGEEIHAKDQKVNVVLPTFDITVNNHTINNAYRKYPFIVYKDITYFPMTWYDSRLLGLEATWSQENGLEIKKSKVTASYEPYRTNQKNAKSYQAKIMQGTIKLNGIIIDNQTQNYPFLIFHDITYFPLTWEFAHNQFGWGYKWDLEKGLTITSNNPQIQPIPLPADSKNGPIALFNGYYYYTESNNVNHYVYRSPISNFSVKEEVFAYPIDTYSINKVIKFFVQDEKLWFYYHQGGAVMGQDVYVKINQDGKGNVEYRGYLDFIHTNLGKVIIDLSVPPSTNNLIFKDQTNNEQRIGNSELIYGWTTTDDGGLSFGDHNKTSFIGNDLYIIGSAYPVNETVKNQLYKINLDTKEMKTIINIPIEDFQIANGYIYYVKKSDHQLYQSTLEGTEEQLLSEHPVTKFRLTNTGVFYVSNHGSVNHLYLVNNNGADSLLLKDQIETIQTDHDYIYVQLSSPDYGMKIFDSAGNLVISITDRVNYSFIGNGKILFTNEKGIYTLTLNGH